MIKNEERILKRCLEAVENLVDCFCICDTGSTDSTQEVAREFLKTRTGCLTIEPWQNFGYNRTISFVNAQKFVKDLGWNLEETYGILLDADMMFVPGKLREHKLGAIGYKIIQKNANLEYYNTRIIRMDYAWKCLGVTHEYWDGPSDNLEKDVCFIDDRDDGGCKHDKFERDAKLLEDGLSKEPDNVRYMFYLAQTYKCVGRFADAITMYKNRIKAGGWAEEIWNSYYSIGDCYLKLKKFSKFEDWMQQAHTFRPCRSESIYTLAKYFREIGQHYKSYHYIKLGLSIPFPKDDVLFIESDVYRGLFNYESSIVEYYIHPEKCLRTTIDYMLKLSHFQDNCVSNLKFSVKPLSNSKFTKLNLPSPFGQDFRPSAISICDYPMANVRYVNYVIQPNGSYIMPNGIVVTKNAYVNLVTNECSIMEEPLVNFETHIKGLEDLRLYKNSNGKLCFTATSFKQFIDNKICIVHGDYDLETKTYKNYQGIQSPFNLECEKNWVNVPGTDDFIYSWNPLRIGKIRNDKFIFVKETATLPLFSLFRGSASPIEVNGNWLVLVHFVEYCQPRKYYHCFVELEKETYKVLKVSLPFVFESIGIEYSISGRLVEDSLEYYFSSWDRNPAKIEFKLSTIEWIEVSSIIPKTLDEPIKTTFVTALIDPNELRPNTKPPEKYFEHFKKLADSGVSLHVFLSECYAEKFNELYSKNPNIYVETIKFEDLRAYKEIQDVDCILPKIRCPIKDTKSFMIIIHSKIEFLYKAITRNSFNNDNFAWIDFGIAHIIKNNSTFKKLHNLKIKQPGIYAPSLLPPNNQENFDNVNWRFPCGIYIGDKQSLIDLYNIYFDNFKRTIEEKKILTWEANYWQYLEYKYGLKVNTYSAGFNDSIINNI